MLGESVTIRGRAFRLGAVYVPKAYAKAARPRRLVRAVGDYGLSSISYELLLEDGRCRRRHCSALEWVEFAGEEMADAG